MWIRKATSEDKDAIIAIWRDNATWLGGLNIGALNAAIAKKEVHVADLDGVIGGFVHYHMRRDNISTIYHIATKSDAQGQGIGAQLLYSVPCPIQLKVTQDNKQAIRFYERHNMLRTDSITHTKDKNGELKILERPLYRYYLHTLFIQCAGNNKKFPEICQQAGIPYGSRHDNTICGELYMLDINWEKYDCAASLIA